MTAEGSRWHVQPISQERAQEPHHGRLQAESQPVVFATPFRDQRAVGVIQEEEPLQLSTPRQPDEPAVPS